jgi:hypothetical protein
MVLSILLSCLPANSYNEIAKDEAVLWIAWASDAIFPAPLAMWARCIVLIGQSLKMGLVCVKGSDSL